ncbi:hypothetical protein GDO86_014401 [Hymenochirus boettgeri]|uniref:Homologous recombination OB-fold protein OB-fold domain-containing protein n=1 Tax=Hymenochirus boettgeri TaxID=247094 RepID=A0A8T2JRM4_9PIPI|nr:hypothetical protein GDO86_014401 [Hymenochirus boettgeri]
MALSFQNLFSTESDDFDDEEFLSALDHTEHKVVHTVPTVVRPLRPIAQPNFRDDPDPQHVVEQRISSDLDQDIDDEELLSACSMLEVPERPFKEQEPWQCLRNVTAAQQNVPHQDCALIIPPYQNVHYSGEGYHQFKPHTPRMSSRVIAECMPDTTHGNIIGANSTTTLQTLSDAEGNKHLSSAGPTAKRPCRRDTTVFQAVTNREETQSHGSPAIHLQAGLHHDMLKKRSVQPWGGQGLQQNSPLLGNNNTVMVSKVPLSSPRPLISNSLQSPVVTNHLVQLMSTTNKTSRRLSWETSTHKERRFPGPAGLLPQQGNLKGLDEILISAPQSPSHGAIAKLNTKTNITSPQTVEEEYARGPWAALKAELALNENDPRCFLRTYSVVMVLRKAALKQLPKNKVPQMAVALKSLTLANGDASAVFRDPTGEIQGTVHHLLLEEKESDLKVGSVLLLQQVGVFSPSHRNHYLNVTPSNLVKVYLPEDEGHSKMLVEPPVSIKQTRNKIQIQPRPSTSTALSGAPRTASTGGWDTDDLDFLLCDLPEDTGD